MNAIWAVVRAGVPGRAAMLAASVVLALGWRSFSSGEWENSDERVLAIAVLEFGLLPIFAAMLGAALVRGEHAPWSWGFARPMSRARWVATGLVLDASFFATVLVLFDAILGAIPWRLMEDAARVASLGFGSPRFLGRPYILAVVYVSGAIGSLRGHAGLRAVPVGMIYIVSFVLLTALVTRIDSVVMGFPLYGYVTANSRWSRFDTLRWGGYIGLLGSWTISTAILGGAVHTLVRGLSRAPATLPRRDVIIAFTMWSIGAGATMWLLWAVV